VTRVDVHSLTDRVSGKLWVDDETGLILRRELKDGAGTIIRRSWFSDLTIDDVRAPADGPAASLVSSSGGSAAAGGGGAALDDADLDRLRKGGTVIPAYLPAGMRLVGAWRLPLTGPDAIALSYSDGLFSLSLFLQPGVLDQSDLTGFTAHQVAGAGVWAHCGLSREVTWAGDATVYTIVTDAPDATVTAVIGALPADPPAEGMVSRMGRGAHRVASWVDPFS
jgi:sigma-E factor negative regulatory protein RseB